MLRLGSVSSLFYACAFVAAACSSSSSTPTPTPSTDAGPSEGGTTTTEGGDGTVTMTGEIHDLANAGGRVAGATVVAGAVTATTDAKGAYTMQILPNVPFNMKVSAANYYTLLEQEARAIGGEIDRGDPLLQIERAARLK